MLMALLIVIGAIGYFFMNPNIFSSSDGQLSGSLEKKEIKAVPVSVTTVSKQEFIDLVEAVGTAFALESADISPNVTEVIEEIHFSDGQQVRKGQILVTLRQAEEQAQLNAARVNLKEQEREIRRLQGLVDSGAVAVFELDTRKTQKELALQEIGRIEAQISDRIIRAPFSGVLGLRNISPGALVSPQTVITTLDAINKIKLDFTIPEIYLSQATEGVEIEARSQAFPDKIFKGTITHVDSRIDPVSRSVTVRAEIDNPERLLKQGMLMYVEILFAPTTSAAVPERALVSRQSKHYVYTLESDIAHIQEVTLGRRKPGYAEVLAGVSLEEKIISDGIQNLVDGNSITVIDTFQQPTQPIDITE